jgi:shikimate dehydrogenase
MTDRYAVIGNPIEHSKSPQIHTAFAAQTGESLEYDRLLGTPGRFAEEVRGFFASGGKGLNVTVPFKLEAWELADECSPWARLARAANTLIPLPGGRLRGDNTDGVGLVRDLQFNHGAELAGKRLLLLGAGGAARGVLGPVCDCRPAAVVIANRTPGRAEQLAAEFAELGRLEGVGLERLAGRRFDLIVNATAAGLQDRVPEIPDDLLNPGGWCYDMMYGDQPTAFVRWGQAHGAVKSLDGLGMLVEQAAESFYIWRGRRPDTAPVIRALRA